MKCGICGQELDENGHCIPCERRAELNNLREMTTEERLNYQGTTIDQNEDDPQNQYSSQNQNQFQYKIYTPGSSFTGRITFYLIMMAILLFFFFFVLPMAFAGVLIAVIVGVVIGLWHYLTR